MTMRFFILTTKYMGRERVVYLVKNPIFNKSRAAVLNLGTATLRKRLFLEETDFILSYLHSVLGLNMNRKGLFDSALLTLSKLNSDSRLRMRKNPVYSKYSTQVRISLRRCPTVLVDPGIRLKLSYMRHS